jgi:putative addiction module component (TIGR02574 family)
MTASIKALGIDRMSPDERLKLLEEIWDSLDAEADQAPLTDAQRQDLERRIAAYEANPKAGSSWDDVKARLRQRP